MGNFKIPTFSSDADRFRNHVKTLHKIPQDVDTWKKFKVVHVTNELNPQGHYKFQFFGFKDGSWWRVSDGKTSTDFEETGSKELDLREDLLYLDEELAEAKQHLAFAREQLEEAESVWFIRPNKREERVAAAKTNISLINQHILQLYAETTKKQRELHKLKFGKDK